jgi:hypothetical protein
MYVCVCVCVCVCMCVCARARAHSSERPRKITQYVRLAVIRTGFVSNTWVKQDSAVTYSEPAWDDAAAVVSSEICSVPMLVRITGSSAEVKNAWSYASTPPVGLYGVVLC